MISLNGVWQGKCFTETHDVDFCFEGQVPGCVHTDLLGKQLPKDIYYQDNADECAWVENRDFEYSRVFRIDALPRSAKLVFDGLDVYADVYVNGVHIAATDNMFIRYSFDVSGVLREGENTVSVYFHSPIKRVEGLPLCDGAFTRERMRTRRIQCTYGWDWVARFVTMGIWRDVYLDCSDGFGVKDAYIYTDTIADDYASVVIETEFEGFEDGGYADFEIVSPTGESVYSHKFFVKEELLKIYVDIRDPKLWYPAGYGEQPIYKLKVCQKEFLFGIRSAKVVELTDAVGSEYYEKCLEIKRSESARVYDRNEEFSGFVLIINGVPIFCQGANWVPCEPFPSAESDEKITELLTLAREAGLNMLRVWGGGIFEKRHFYDECDRLGILVTQDFLMACGSYPEREADFIEQIRKEAEFASRELRNHPSLVWWSGDNENAVDGFDMAEDYHGRTAIYSAIYPVLNRLDPHRRFFLSSPYGGVPYASKTRGTTHNTNYLGMIFSYIQNEDMADYKEYFSDYLARFIAEEPTLGAVCLPSLRKFMTDEDIFGGEEMWNYHTKNNPYLSFTIFDALNSFSRKVLGEFDGAEDRLFKLKYAQYEWVRISLENARRNSGFINGIIYWMWNDCWPASSGWALVDYYCLPKASFYSFKRCGKQIMASIDRGAEYEIYLCNKGLSDEKLLMSLKYVHNGEVRELSSFEATACADSSKKILSLPLDAIPDGAILICDVSGEGIFDRAFYKAGALDMALSTSARIVERTEDTITVSSSGYVHALELEGEYVFEDNYFSMLPYEQRTIRYRRANDAKSDDIKLIAYGLK